MAEATPPEPDEPAAAPEGETQRRRPARKPLPETLPRDVVEHAAPCACPRCGGALRALGEDVTEVLDYVPGAFRVTRHVRPKLSCRSCEAIAQAPAPSLPIHRGLAGPGLLAHVLVAKYCDHLPLYRQAEIYARAGIELDRSTLADWVGQTARLMRPLVEAVGVHVMSAERVHADDTTVPVLDPAAARPKRDGCGVTRAMTSRSAARRHRRCCIATARTAKANIRGRTSPGSAASCRRTDTRAMPDCMTAV